MRIVLDTNTLISGVISPNGAPRQLLNAARLQTFELCSSAVLMADLIVSDDKHLHSLGGQYQGIPL